MSGFSARAEEKLQPIGSIIKVWRVGADLHGTGCGSLVLGLEVDAVLAAVEEITTPKNLATQINAR